MWLVPVGLTLAAAGLHAGWNLIVKREDDKLLSGWLTVLTPCVLLLPVLLATGLPAAPAWPVLLGSALLHTGYMIALTRAYEHGDLSVVYPVARGLAPLLVAVCAPVLLGERLSGMGVAGIVCIGGGLAALGCSNPRSDQARAGLAWAAVTAVFIAGYSMLDKVGVGRANPLAYIIALFAANAAFMAPYVLWRRRARATRTRRWGLQVTGGLLSLGAYLLVLMAMRLAQVSYVAALRETSVILGALLGWRVLGEGYGWRRVVASGLVASGLILLVVAMRG